MKGTINKNDLAQLSNATTQFFATEQEANAQRDILKSENKLVIVSHILVFCDDMTDEDVVIRKQEIVAGLDVSVTESQKNFALSLAQCVDMYKLIVTHNDAAEVHARNMALSVMMYDDELNGATVA